jgi:hypothetical protein
MAALTTQRLQVLAAAATAAPSADNRHVFRLEARGDSLHLIATRDWPNAPPGRRILGLISIGAVAENLVLRAGRLGMHLDEHWRLDEATGPELARFDCRDAAVVQDPLEAAIELRHSNRRLRFHGPCLPPDARDEISKSAQGIERTRLVWLDAAAARQQALRLIRWAETERFGNQALHREMFDSIRFDAGWTGTVSEGLPPGALELPWFERPAFAALRHWGVQRAANLMGAHRWIGARAADLPCRLAPHLCAIAAEGDIATGAVLAGRSMERVWLQATKRRLAVQVFAASPLYAMKGCAPIGEALVHRLASEWSRLCVHGRPYLVLRMGYAKPPSVRAGRPKAMEVRTESA